MITIRVNGRELPATAGANLLEVLQSADTRIPAVCFHPALKSATGICRLCTVEVAHERAVDHHPGRQRTPPLVPGVRQAAIAAGFLDPDPPLLMARII